jgi:hypothetical protein
MRLRSTEIIDIKSKTITDNYGARKVRMPRLLAISEAVGCKVIEGASLSGNGSGLVMANAYTEGPILLEPRTNRLIGAFFLAVIPTVCTVGLTVQLIDRIPASNQTIPTNEQLANY